MIQPKTAKEFMVTKLITLTPDKHVCDGVARLLKHKITGAPVVDRDHNFLGVFSEKCCMRVLGVMSQSASEDGRASADTVQAKDFMTTKLITLSPETDVFDAINQLLANRISGAPVLDSDGNFLGVFSEKNSMQVLMSAAYDQLPTTRVDALMNRDQGRVISPETGLFEVAQIFAETPLRRLEVVENGKLLGQISRRDVLRMQQQFSENVRHRIKVLADQIATPQEGSESDNGSESDAPVRSDANGKNQTHEVGYFMDSQARTIGEDARFLEVARVFLDTPYRRLPVVTDGKLVGQISRRDVLHAANELTTVPATREKSILYLSSLVDRQDSPFS